MKRLFKEIVIVLGIFVLIVFCAEWRLRGVEAPIDYLFETINNSENRDKDVVIIGNSHTGALLFTTDSVFLSRSINLSMPNLELLDRLKVLQYTLENIRVKKVILGLDADQIGHIISSASYDMQMNKYGLPMHNNSVGNRVISHLNSFRLKLNIKELAKTLLNGKPQKQEALNFIPFTDKKKSDLEACEKRALEHGLYSYQSSLVDENLSILVRIVELCKSRNVGLYLLQTPKTTCYTNTFNNEKMVAASRIIDSFALQNNTPFYNYLAVPIFSDEDFKDFDHLNKQGANKLINLLKRQIFIGL